MVARKDARVAVDYLESFRGKPQNSETIDSVCEELLLERGEIELAYSRYAISANQMTTRLATVRAIEKKYPSMNVPDI